MSRLAALLRLALDWLNAPTVPAAPQGEGAHDWADLPPHHPLCDTAPR